MMTEKLMQDLLKYFPCELIEEGLEYLNREITTGGRRLDLAFVDRRKRILLIEVQKDSLDTKHIDRHIDFVEGFAERNPDADLRLMYIANRIDHLRKSFLEKRGYEYLEIPAIKFIELAKRHDVKIEEDTLEYGTLNTMSANLQSFNLEREHSFANNKIQIKSNSKITMQEFWKSYKIKLNYRFPSIQSDQTPLEKYKFDITFGFHDTFIQNYCFLKENKVQLRLMLKKNSAEAFQFLYCRKDRIQNDIGKQLLWNAELKIKRIEIEFATDFENAEKIEEALNWLVDNTIIFYKIFPKYLNNAPI